MVLQKAKAPMTRDGLISIETTQFNTHTYTYTHTNTHKHAHTHAHTHTSDYKLLQIPRILDYS